MIEGLLIFFGIIFVGIVNFVGAVLLKMLEDVL